VIERQVALVTDLARNPQVWAVLVLFGIFIISLERVEGFLFGPWPHQRRGDDRFNPLALGSRSAWLAVATLLLPGLLLALVNAVVRLSRGLPANSLGLPTDSLTWLGLVLLLVSWLVFVAGSTNVLRFGQYLRRIGLLTPMALLVCLLLGDVMLLLALMEATR